MAVNSDSASFEFAPGVVVVISRHDSPRDVDEAYGAGTYGRLFPDEDEEAL